MEKEAQQVDYAAPQQTYRRKVHVRLDEDLYRKLRAYTAQQGVTVQQFLEGLIRQTVGG